MCKKLFQDFKDFKIREVGGQGMGPDSEIPPNLWKRHSNLHLITNCFFSHK
jgi:hypothetical protein